MQLAAQASAVDRQVKPLADRLADLDHRDQEVMAAAQVARERADTAAKSLADVAQQLATLNAERARTPQVERGDVDALAARLASLETATKAIGEQLARIAGGTAAASSNARQTVGVIALYTAVERGLPYVGELDAVRPFADPATVSALEPFAKSGVPSAAGLAHEVSALVPALVSAADTRQPEGALARLWANAKRMIRLRPVGNVPGDDPAAVIARLELKAGQNDLDGVLAEANNLPAAARGAARALGQARAGARGGACGGRSRRDRHAQPSRPRRSRPKARLRAMIRVVLFLVAVGLASFAAVMLADQPGQVSITWFGYHAEPPVPLLIVVIAVVSITVWSVLLMLIRAPGRIASGVRHRRSARGYQAITRGLIAIGAGDVKAARRFAGEAKRLAGDEPLALLLGAQTAQLAGNRPAAEVIFRRMADQGETKLLGLHGLFVEAQRKNDMAAARTVAEEAVQANPAVAWAAQAVLDARCAEHDWPGALAALDSNLKSGLTDKASFRRRRAVLLTARALSGEDRDAARADVLEAVKLAPGLVPAAALAGRLLAEAGEARKAGRILEAAWRINPHPDLAEAFAHVRSGDSARDRLARVQSLARQGGDSPEGMLAVANAAIDAREFGAARAALAPLMASPTRRVALMMAEIEERDAGDIGRARQWTARALAAAHDPAWTADGLVSDKWLPVSPVTGRLDAFQWKVPLADLNPPGRVIEQAEFAAVAAPRPRAAVEPSRSGSATPNDADTVEDAPPSPAWHPTRPRRPSPPPARKSFSRPSCRAAR